jgi:hypothetical protein
VNLFAGSIPAPASIFRSVSLDDEAFFLRAGSIDSLAPASSPSGLRLCRFGSRGLPPYLDVELARQYLSGELRVLNHEQVARANAGAGLNVVTCFEGWAHDGLSPEQVLAVRAKQG